MACTRDVERGQQRLAAARIRVRAREMLLPLLPSAMATPAAVGADGEAAAVELGVSDGTTAAGGATPSACPPVLLAAVSTDSAATCAEATLAYDAEITQRGWREKLG